MAFRRSPLPAAFAAVAVATLFAVPLVVTAVQRSPAGTRPVFPAEIAPYSWWTAGLGPGEVEAASAIYQNGYGVEFLDAPQSIALGADGSTYRRLTAAERLGIPADQGDPARGVLSPDGTLVVLAGAAGHGELRAVTLADGAERALPIGEGRSGIPVGMTRDEVLVLTGAEAMSRYTDIDFRLHGELAVLALGSGELRVIDTVTDVEAAALSPDGSRIVALTADGMTLLDAEGRVLARDLPTGGGSVDGDAWSPDGTRFASMDGGILRLIDVSAGPTSSEIRTDFAWGTAIGWRDAHTVLAVGAGGGTDVADETARFAWIDVRTGEQETLATYRPPFTGAAIGAVDVARDLVPQWRDAATTGADRGLPPWWLVLGATGLAALVAWACTPRRRPPVPVGTRSAPEPDPAAASAPRMREWQT